LFTFAAFGKIVITNMRISPVQLDDKWDVTQLHLLFLPTGSQPDMW
jgi:hypothetical protein